ncbi:MAG: coproporphyrinogen III oxidase family protein [Gammaproteobacteria bacterium]|nr:coproporphyrinogen III oxidase family protein [Gammaproteobacteria bacterium]
MKTNKDTAYWRQQAESYLYDVVGLHEVRQTGILPASGNKFFPVIGYPPLTMFSSMDESPLFENIVSRNVNPTAGYLHIPFCPTRCTFCHWITKTKSKAEEVDVYIDYLIREMALYAQKMGVSSIPLKSVLWGGGTPTYPDANQLEKLLKAYVSYFDLSGCTQFSVEAEPTTLLGDEGMARLKVLKDYGVDRISLGVQSFDDDVLRYMARAHDNEQTIAAIKNIRLAGIDNISIDLIYGYPGQTVDNWINNLNIAINLDIEGWQLYRLRIRQHGDRPGNIIREFEKRPERFSSAEEILQMKALGMLMSVKNGYGEHLRRVFGKTADGISHYLRDWTANLYDVVGVGVSSWSNLRGVFTQNIGDQNLSSYYDLIDAGKVSVNRGKIRTADDEQRRAFLLPLKNRVVEKSEFRRLTGCDVSQRFGVEMDWLKSLGMIEESASQIWLTEKGGFFADEVATQFFDPAYLPFPEVARPPGL